MEKLSDDEFLLRRLFLAAKTFAKCDLETTEDEWSEFFDAMVEAAEHLGYGDEFDALLAGLPEPPEPPPLAPGETTLTPAAFTRDALRRLTSESLFLGPIGRSLKSADQPTRTDPDPA